MKHAEMEDWPFPPRQPPVPINSLRDSIGERRTVSHCPLLPRLRGRERENRKAGSGSVGYFLKVRMYATSPLISSSFKPSAGFIKVLSSLSLRPSLMAFM